MCGKVRVDYLSEKLNFYSVNFYVNLCVCILVFVICCFVFRDFSFFIVYFLNYILESY